MDRQTVLAFFGRLSDMVDMFFPSAETVTMTDPYLMLFVPADRPERYAKAASAGADAVIVDLEDAIGESGKDAARETLKTGLADATFAAPVFVRVNAAGTRHFEADVAALDGLAIAGVVLPKTERAEDLEALRDRYPALEMVALVESAFGVGAARAIARAADRTLFGSIDLAVSIGAEHRRESLLAARSELVLACALAGRPAPVDGVTTSIDDASEIEDDAGYASALGFRGKILIHPRQIAPALRGFMPDESDVEEARRVLAASGGEAVKLDGKMVDVPVVENARRLLERFERGAARLAELENRT